MLSSAITKENDDDDDYLREWTKSGRKHLPLVGTKTTQDRRKAGYNKLLQIGVGKHRGVSVKANICKGLNLISVICHVKEITTNKQKKVGSQFQDVMKSRVGRRLSAFPYVNMQDTGGVNSGTQEVRNLDTQYTGTAPSPNNKTLTYKLFLGVCVPIPCPKTYTIS